MNTFMWVFLLFINVVFFAISTILQKIILKGTQSKPIAFSIFFQLFSGIFILIVGLLFGHMSFPTVQPLLLNLLLGILLYGFANVFIFKALKRTEASKFTVIFATRLIFTIIASSILLREEITGIQLFGSFLIFLGIFLISFKTQKFAFGIGDFYALIAAVCFGLANVNARFLLHSFLVLPYLSYVFIAPALFLSALYPKELRYISLFLKQKTLVKTIILCIFWSLANLAFFAALKMNTFTTSQTTAASLISVVVTVLLSVIVLKEQNNMWRKVFASIISFVGLVLLVL